MNRRGFLGALTAAVTGEVLDPDKLLWRPRAKLISVPRIVTAFPDPHCLSIDEFAERYIHPYLEAMNKRWIEDMNRHIASYSMVPTR